MSVDNSAGILGRQVVDKITGFRGVVTGFVQFLTGCNQALVAPKVKDDGTLVDSSWLDLQRLEYLSEDVVSLDNSKSPGFDRSPPKR